MTTENNSKMKFGGWLAATLSAPIIVISVELWITRHFNLGSTNWDWIGLALSLIAGLCCLWRLPVSVTKRVWLAIVFIPIITVLLWFYALLFVCGVFGDCP
jgi:hypothetical protein